MKHTHFLASLLGAVGLALFPAVAAPLPVDWTGLTDNNWSTATNWGDNTVPANPSSGYFQFSTSTHTSPNVTVAWTVGGLVFESGANAFTLGGEALTLGAGGITNNATHLQTINNALIFNTAQSWNIASGTLAVTGGISGSYGLTKTSSGTLVITSYDHENTNSYTGGTTISGGVLSIGHDNDLGDSSGAITFDGGTLQTYHGITSDRPITLTGNGTIDAAGQGPFNGSNSSDFYGQITGNGSLTVKDSLGGGKVTLGYGGEGGNTYSGGTFIDGNSPYGVRLQLAAENMLGTGRVTMSGAGDPQGYGAILNLKANNVTGYNQTIGSLQGDALSEVKLNGATLTTGGDNTSTTFAGLFSSNTEGGALVKNGTGTFTITSFDNGNENYLYGGTTINAGVLSIGADSDLGGYNGSLIFNGGTLQTYHGGYFSFPLTLENNGGTIDVAGNRSEFSGYIGNGEGGGQLTVKNSVGNGVLTFSNWGNNYSGGTLVSGASGNITVMAGAGDTFGTGNMTVNGSGHTATLDLNGYSQTTGPLAGDNAGVVRINDADLTISENGQSTVFAGKITGNGSLTVSGNETVGGGTLTLSGANNDYSGGTTVEGGNVTVTLKAGAVNAFGKGAITMMGNAILDLLGFDQTIGFLNGDLHSMAHLTDGANLTTGGDDSDSQFDGTIDGTGNLVKIGSGTFTLTGANSYSGSTTINGGTLWLDFNGSNSPVDNILNSSSALIFGGGTLSVAGKGNSTSSQAFASTMLNPGASAITVTSSGEGTTALNLGALIRNTGATVDFSLPSHGAISTSTTATNGILGGWATVTNADGTVDWATVSSGNITALAPGSYVANNWGPGFNTDVTVSSAPGFGSTTNSLRFGAASSTTITLSGTNTLTSGGILMTPNVGSNATIITGGTLQAASGKDLVVIQNNTGGSLAITSNIAGNAGLTKSGDGVLALSGLNSYTGGTTINAGALSIGADTALGDSTGPVVFNGGALQFSGDVNSARAITLNRDGAIDVNATSSVLTGPITGQGGLAVVDTSGHSSSETLTLSGSNNYAGGTLVGSSLGSVTLAAGNVNVFGSGPMAVYGNGNENGYTATLDLNGHSQTVGSLAGDWAGVVNLNGATLTTGGDNTDTTFAGKISGASVGGGGSLVKNGTGTFTIRSWSDSEITNTYTGGTTINAGVLSIGANSDLGDPSGPLTFNGGTLQTHNGVASARTITLASGGGAIDAYENSSEFSGSITGGGSLTIVDRSGYGDVTLSGANNTYAGGTLIDGTSGTVTLRAGAENSHVFGTGPMTINGGSNWATLDLNYNSQTVGPLAGDQNGEVYLNGASLTIDQKGGSTMFAGSIYGDGGLTVMDSHGGGTLVLSGSGYHGPSAYSGGASVAGYGGGGYSGGTTVDGGSGSVTLRAGGDDAFGSGPMTVNGNGHTATLDLNGSYQEVGTLTGDAAGVINLSNGAELETYVQGNTPEFAGKITGSGGWLGVFGNSESGGATLTLSGTNNDYSGGTYIVGYPGAVTLRAGAANVFGTGGMEIYGDSSTATLDLNGHNQKVGYLEGDSNGVVNLHNASLTTDESGRETQFSGTITGNGSLTVADSSNGHGRLTLSGANDYSGGTIIDGTSGDVSLVAGNASAFGSGPMTVSGHGHIATLDLNYSSQAIASLAGDMGGVVNLDGAQLTVSGNGTSTTFAGTIINTGEGGSLVKSGNGILVLSGVNNYYGGTTVEAGTLLANNISGSATGSGEVTIMNGATLGGSGSIGGLATFESGAHLAPGNSPGVLTFAGGLTLEASSILDFQLGAVSDLIRVTGGLLTGPETGLITLNLSNAGGFVAGTYTLFDFSTGETTTSSFDAADFTFGTTIPNYTYSLALSSGTLALIATAIPEPSTYAVLFGGFALGVAIALRRKTKA